MKSERVPSTLLSTPFQKRVVSTRVYCTFYVRVFIHERTRSEIVSRLLVDELYVAGIGNQKINDKQIDRSSRESGFQRPFGGF
jgi:hypothetical protein